MYRAGYCLFALAGALLAQSTPAKQYKNAAEFDAYNAVVKDMGANHFAQAIADLDAWKQKYPETDYQAEREVLYLKACVSAKQYAKAVDEAGEVMGKGLERVFGDLKDGATEEVQLLYNATISVPMIADPTPSEVTAGEAVARRLMNLDRRPAGLSDADWTKLRSDVQGPAKAALVYLALLPGVRAMTAKPPDCSGAQALLEKALGGYPDSAAVAYHLGRAYLCEKKYSAAIYEFARAEGLDATLGGAQDAARLRAMVADDYRQIHGSAEGLDQLRQQTKQSAMPPEGFEIQTAAQIAQEKEEQFARSNPQLALWMSIKAKLTGAGGAEYFESQLKNAAVPPLKGVLVEAKPACRPKELLVAVPLPDSGAVQQAEIALKLDKPLSGKPETGAEFQWQGVPSAFTANPFLLTMDTEAATIDGLRSTPCAAPARKK